MAYAVIMSALVVIYLCFESYQNRKMHESDNECRRDNIDSAKSNSKKEES